MSIRLTMGGFPMEALLDQNPNWRQSAREAISVGLRIKRLQRENKMLLLALMAILRKFGGSLLIEEIHFKNIREGDELVRVKQDKTGDLLLTIRPCGYQKTDEKKIHSVVGGL